jgi:hypothetical protein
VTLSPTGPDALRRLERLADRLRVVGPRLAARSGAEAVELLRRIRAGLQDLADLAADTDGRPRRPVPELSGFALADQALVLGHDLLGPDPAGRERSDTSRIAAVEAIQRLYGLL